MDGLLQTVVDCIDSAKTSLDDLSQAIWRLKELRFQEKESHAILCQFLENHGFDVDRSCSGSGLDTAFVACWETKSDAHVSLKKPHVAVICEYDALPEIGHACGHNLIAELGVAAALAIKTALEKNGSIMAKLSVIGTPGEEGGGGKIYMLKSGVFKDVDIALMAHPAPFSDARPVFLSSKRFTANFHGEPSHACGFPWEGINALDAAVQAYVSIGTMRQQMKPEWRASAIITKGGLRTNIIPSEAEVQFQIRTPRESEVQELERKVKRCFTAAAEATGCTVDIVDGPNPYKCLITNDTLAKLYESSLADLGEEVPIPKTKIVLGSTDMGDVSHVVPSMHPTYNCNTAAFNHTPQFAQASASPDAQAPTLIQAKALAMTALKVLHEPSLLNDIRRDFQKDMDHA